MALESTSNVRFMYKGLEIDEATKDYILKRMEQVYKVIDKILHTEVEIGLDKKGYFRVEVMVKTPYELYRAEDTTISVEGSIDSIVDDLKVQATKDSDKRKTMIKRGARSIKKKIVLDNDSRFRK